MTDPRTTPDASLVNLSESARVTVPVCDLRRTPNGPRDRQLLYGDAVTVLHRTETHCLVRSDKDQYCGWLRAGETNKPSVATHRVSARATHMYRDSDIKSEENYSLSFGSLLTVIDEKPTFVKTEDGFVPRQHVHSIQSLASDPAAVAALFIGTPYLWGGNSAFGIDCSGLIQAACLACGLACPGDSDQQEKTLGSPMESDTPLQRNDLIFWKGHVALVFDDKTLVHANAGHMATVFEPIQNAINRIEDQGDGRPTSYKRLPNIATV